METLGLSAMRVIGALYVALGAWCALAPRDTANFVGFDLKGDTGLSEYITATAASRSASARRCC